MSEGLGTAESLARATGTGYVLIMLPDQNIIEFTERQQRLKQNIIRGLEESNCRVAQLNNIVPSPVPDGSEIVVVATDDRKVSLNRLLDNVNRKLSSLRGG